MKNKIYKIWDKKNKRYIEDDKDINNRKGFCLGEYALRSDGKVVFYESTEGGMDTTEIDNVEVIFNK